MAGDARHRHQPVRRQRRPLERVGPAVTEFAEGDEVMAYDREDHVQWGTLAEMVGVPIRGVAPKPPGLGWAEAGALPLAGLTAYQCVLAAGVGPGDAVLVHGASGGGLVARLRMSCRRAPA